MISKTKFVLFILFFAPFLLIGAEIDKQIKEYKKIPNISGMLNSVGSDTLNNLMILWAENFRKIYPSIQIQIEGKGSSTAPPALIEGTAQLGAMSRIMKKSEIEKFEKKYGFQPTRFIIALDSLVIIVNKDNPIEQLTLPEVDAIFSSTLKGGHQKLINKWSDTGLQGIWKNRNISLYGRNSASGTYGYFKQVALFKGDYRKNVKEQPGSASVVQSIGVDKYAIGYSGIGFLTSNIKTIKIAKNYGGIYYSPLKYQNILNGDYPLTRGLNIYIIKDPQKGIEPIVKEFLKYIFSKEGQEIVIKEGYLPLSYRLIQKYSKLLQ